MIPVFSFSVSDCDLALAQAKWISELDAPRNRGCVAVHDCRVPAAVASSIEAELGKSFSKVDMFSPSFPLPREGWPEGANMLFLAGAYRANKIHGDAFLWLEPDAVPLQNDWLEVIENDYNQAGKPWMGVIQRPKGNEHWPMHMTGVGVWPGNTYDACPREALDLRTAFDVAFGKLTCSEHNVNDTHLIWHVYNSGLRSPVFPDITVVKGFVPFWCVLAHRCKDTSLIDALRKDRQLGNKWWDISVDENRQHSGLVGDARH